MNSSKPHKITTLLIVIIFVSFFGLNPLLAAKTSSPEALPTAYQSLQSLNLQEKQVLGHLFDLSQSMVNSKKRIAELDKEQLLLQKEAEKLNKSVAVAQRTYEETKTKAAGAVRYLQRLGPVSYLEIVAGSSSLADFWQRLNLLSSSLGGIDRNLNLLKEQRNQLFSTREALLEKERQLQTSLAAEAATLAKLTQAQQEQEAFLADLGLQRRVYEEVLSQLESLWVQDTLPYLIKVNQELSYILTQGDFSAISWYATKDGFAASIPLAVANTQLQTRDSLQGIALVKEAEKIKLQIPSRSLELLCSISIKDGHSVVFTVEQAWLAGILISQEAVRQLQAEPIEVNLEKDLGIFRLREFYWDNNNFVLHLSF